MDSHANGGSAPHLGFPPISKEWHGLFGIPGTPHGRFAPSSMRRLCFVPHLFSAMLASLVAGTDGKGGPSEEPARGNKSDVSNSTSIQGDDQAGLVSAVVLIGGFVLAVFVAAIYREMKHRRRFQELMADLCGRPLTECPEELRPVSGIWSGLSEDNEFCARICPISQRVFRWTVNFSPDGTLKGTGSDNDGAFSISGKYTVAVPIGHNRSFGRGTSFGRTKSPQSFRHAKTEFIWLETPISDGKSLEDGLTVEDHAHIAQRLNDGDTFCARMTCHICQDMEMLKVCKGSLQFENSEVSIVGTYMTTKSAFGTFSQRLISMQPTAEIIQQPDAHEDAEADVSVPAAKNSQAENVQSFASKIGSFRGHPQLSGPPKLSERESQFESHSKHSSKIGSSRGLPKLSERESQPRDAQFDSVRSSDSRQSKGIMKRSDSIPQSLYQSQESMASSVQSDVKRANSMRDSGRRLKESQSRLPRRVDRAGSAPVRDMEDIAREEENNLFHLDEQVASIKEHEELREDDPADFHQPPLSSLDARRTGRRRGRELGRDRLRKTSSARDSAGASESTSPPWSAPGVASPKISWRDGFDPGRGRENGGSVPSDGTGTPKVSWRDGFNGEPSSPKGKKKDEVDSQKVSWRDDFDQPHARQSVPPRQPSSGHPSFSPKQQPSSGDSIREEMIPLPTDEEARQGFKSNTSSLFGSHNPDPPSRQGSQPGWTGMGGSTMKKDKKREQNKSPPAIVMTENSQVSVISADFVEAPRRNGGNGHDASYTNLSKVTSNQLDDRGSALDIKRLEKPGHEREDPNRQRARGSRSDEIEVEAESTSARAREGGSSARRQDAALEAGRLREERQKRDRGGREDGGRADGRSNGRDEGGRDRSASAQTAHAESGPSARGGEQREERREHRRTGSSRPGHGQAADGSSRAERAGGEGGRELGRAGSRRQESAARALPQAPPSDARALPEAPPRAAPGPGLAMLTPRGKHLVT